MLKQGFHVFRSSLSSTNDSLFLQLEQEMMILNLHPTRVIFFVFLHIFELDLLCYGVRKLPFLQSSSFYISPQILRFITSPLNSMGKHFKPDKFYPVIYRACDLCCL